MPTTSARRIKARPKAKTKTKAKKIIGLDTETTGLDLRHGAKPFFVTICDHEEVLSYWEWDVNPITREPIIPDGDIDEIRGEIDYADLIVIQNSKFDVAALDTIGISDWPWHKTLRHSAR
jgi:hypothetical protein